MGEGEGVKKQEEKLGWEVDPQQQVKLVEIKRYRASLVAQWLRIRLPMQGTWVRALVREDPICHGATKPMSHNY